LGGVNGKGFVAQYIGGHVQSRIQPAKTQGAVQAA
jgi:hypothetical protein